MTTNTTPATAKTAKTARTAHQHGYADGETWACEAVAAEREEAANDGRPAEAVSPPPRGEWDEGLLNACTAAQLAELGLPARDYDEDAWRRWLAEYNRGADDGAEDYLAVINGDG